MSQFIIEGRKILKGSVRPSGNKNEALPCLMACLLTEEKVVLRRAPQIGDVLTVCEILKKLGVEVEWIDDETVSLQAKKILTTTPAPDLCAKVRASILLLGPMIARAGKISLPLPGGDVIGARRIDTHFESLQGLGCEVSLENGEIRASSRQLTGANLDLDEPSVTATENAIMAAVLASGTTEIYNAACEPHVVGLCKLLKSMGARIEGIGSNLLRIEGVTRLHGALHEIGPDFMEVGSFLSLAAATRSEITVTDVRRDDFRFIERIYAKLGIKLRWEGTGVTVDLRHDFRLQREVSGRIGTIYSAPWPAFPTDLMSVGIVAATQSIGTIIFFEKMFEGRMFFTDKLMQMGANIVLCDPHRIVVTGASPLYAAHLSSPDVRAGMSLLIASLVAKGQSVIENIYQIERGYFNIEKKLQSLGAAITKKS